MCVSFVACSYFIGFTRCFFPQWNKITSIGDDELPHNLQDFTSKGNPIATISDHAFLHSNESLANLLIDNGEFTVLPKALEDLDALRYLGIRKGKLKIIPDGPELLPNVYYVDMFSNQIEDITNIKRFRHSLLTRLDLHNNQISNISAVATLSDMRTLNVFENKICDHEHVSIAVIPHQNTLENLELGRNCMTKIPDVSHLTALLRLGLKQNLIDDCDSGAFPPLLFQLRLQKNKLPCIPKALLGHPNITTICLDYNEITSIDNFVFPSYITDLWLQYNKLENITQIKFDGPNPNLASLQLQNNPTLTNIDKDAFWYMTKNLQTIDLRDTGIKSLPIALSSLANLKTLKAGSSQLTCDCGVGSLAGWWNLRDRTAEGQCGSTDVNDFLDQLSSNCPNGVIG